MHKTQRFGKERTGLIKFSCHYLLFFSFRCPCWLKMAETKIGQKWTGLRTNVLVIVDTPAFEWFVLILIFASSITLCFEDIHLEKNKQLKAILYWTNMVFCVIFAVEMLLKWLAFGFTRYFTSFWTILDFIIVLVSIVNFKTYP